MVDCVVGEQLVLREGPLVGHGRGVNFSVLARVLQLHPLQFIITHLTITEPLLDSFPQSPRLNFPRALTMQFNSKCSDFATIAISFCSLPFNII